MAKPISLLQRAASSLASALTRRGKKKTETSAKAAGEGNGTASKQPRRIRREADIPMDSLAQAYTPTQTSLKGPFRTSGADRSSDQEFARGYSDDERWNDEDRYTNKSGDPRIGTHNRTYEPGEKE